MVRDRDRSVKCTSIMDDVLGVGLKQEHVSGGLIHGKVVMFHSSQSHCICLSLRMEDNFPSDTTGIGLMMDSAPCLSRFAVADMLRISALGPPPHKKAAISSQSGCSTLTGPWLLHLAELGLDRNDGVGAGGWPHASNAGRPTG